MYKLPSLYVFKTKWTLYIWREARGQKFEVLGLSMG